MSLNPRTVLKGLVAGFFAPGIQAGVEETAEPSETYGHLKIWDVHNDVKSLPGNTPEEHIAILVRHMGRLGIERLILS